MDTASSHWSQAMLQSQTAKRTMAADIRKKCNDGVCMLQIFLPLCFRAKRPSRLSRVMKVWGLGSCTADDLEQLQKCHG
jgi:hypothetical protein